MVGLILILAASVVDTDMARKLPDLTARLRCSCASGLT
jgi:hypothetical protein